MFVHNKRTLIGKVVKKSGTRTIKVLITYRSKNKKYHKIVNKNKYFMAHDHHEEAKLGDKVQIIECRPISKMKRFRLLKLIL